VSEDALAGAVADVNAAPPAPAAAERDPYTLPPTYAPPVTAEQATADPVYFGPALLAQQTRAIGEAVMARCREIGTDSDTRRAELLVDQLAPVMGACRGVLDKLYPAADALVNDPPAPLPTGPLTSEEQLLAVNFSRLPRPKQNDLVRDDPTLASVVIRAHPVLTGAQPETLELARHALVPRAEREARTAQRHARARALQAAERSMTGMLAHLRTLTDPALVAASGMEIRRSQMNDAERLEIIRTKGLAHYQSLPR
jgi:hypothetical protein